MELSWGMMQTSNLTFDLLTQNHYGPSSSHGRLVVCEVPLYVRRKWRYREEYEKKLLLRCIHHFKSDLINYMDHMRISGTEPLAKQSSLKVEK